MLKCLQLSLNPATISHFSCRSQLTDMNLVYIMVGSMHTCTRIGMGPRKYNTFDLFFMESHKIKVFSCSLYNENSSLVRPNH